MGREGSDKCVSQQAEITRAEELNCKESLAAKVNSIGGYNIKMYVIVCACDCVCV